MPLGADRAQHRGLCNDQFITDLSETFENLRKFKWKLNSTKCVFGVLSAKLLSFIFSSRGFEANPTKVNAIRFMKPPRSKKDLMKLTGCMAALSRFISRQLTLTNDHF